MISYKSYLKYVGDKYKEIDCETQKNRDNNIMDISGKWHTNWGDITFYQDGNSVTASYDWNNGKMKGTIDGYILKADWEEIFPTENDISRGSCIFKFANTLMSFQGTWYKDNKFEGKGEGIWLGNRGTYPLQNGVDGSYKMSDGRLMLEEGNNNVSGIYLKENSMDYIYLSGNIKSKENNVYKVEGEWFDQMNFLNLQYDGKFELKVDKNNFKASFRYAMFNEDVNSKEYSKGYRVTGPNPLNVEGTWESNIGKMFMESDHGILTISYKGSKAMMEGRIVGNIFLGYWYSAPLYVCPKHSGNAFFEFNTSATSFTGYYTYCDRVYRENQKLSGVINR